MGDHIIVGFAPLPPVVFVRFTLGVCLKSQVTVSWLTDFRSLLAGSLRSKRFRSI